MKGTERGNGLNVTMKTLTRWKRSYRQNVGKGAEGANKRKDRGLCSDVQASDTVGFVGSHAYIHIHANTFKTKYDQ